LAGGLVLGFWTFVGIEFVCSLTEEVREPRRAMPSGIIIGLVAILATSWLMGLGVAGATPPDGATWADTALGAAGCDGSCPQLAVGDAMFGGFGRGLMALASVLATLGSLSVAFAALPRIIFGVARNGQFFGPQVSSFFGRVHPRWGTPVNAVVLFAIASTILALRSSDVVDWVFSGAYVWILLYIAYHVVALADRLIHPERRHLFGPWFLAVPVIGAIGSASGLYYAFDGAHGTYGPRALIVLGVAAVATAVAYHLPGGDEREVIDLTAEGDAAAAPPERAAQPATGEV
jgi:amino acid transporter